MTATCSHVLLRESLVSVTIASRQEKIEGISLAKWEDCLFVFFGGV